MINLSKEVMIQYLCRCGCYDIDIMIDDKYAWGWLAPSKTRDHVGLSVDSSGKVSFLDYEGDYDDAKHIWLNAEALEITEDEWFKE